MKLRRCARSSAPDQNWHARLRHQDLRGEAIGLKCLLKDLGRIKTTVPCSPHSYWMTPQCQDVRPPAPGKPSQEVENHHSSGGQGAATLGEERTAFPDVHKDIEGDYYVERSGLEWHIGGSCTNSSPNDLILRLPKKRTVHFHRCIRPVALQKWRGTSPTDPNLENAVRILGLDNGRHQLQLLHHEWIRLWGVPPTCILRSEMPPAKPGQ